MIEKISLPTLNILYGYRCNYSCDGCFSGSDSIRNADFDPALEEILDSIPRLKQTISVEHMITLMGGEPWLYWEDKIVPIVLSLNQSFPKTKINIFSNGHLLGKNIDKFIHLSKQIEKLCLTVSRHLDPVMDSAPGKHWQKSISTMADHPEIYKISDNHYHVKDNINANIYFSQIENWTPSYRRTPAGQIKPFSTNDPDGSFAKRCGTIGCTCVLGRKLYKCPTLASLSAHLTSLKQIDDLDWQKYLQYQPLDLTMQTSREMKNFADQLHRAVDQCDMCNNNDWSETLGSQRTLQMIFRKAQID